MRWLMLALAALLFAGASPHPVSAARCSNPSTEFDFRVDPCTKSPNFGLPVAYRNRGGVHARTDRHDGANRQEPGAADAYFIRARAYFEKGQYDLAIARYDAAIRLDPDAAGAYVNRGNAYASKGRFARALTDYDTAIRLEPGLASAYINRGLVSVKQDLLDWALRDFGRAYDLKVRPDWMVETLEQHGRLPR